MVAFPLQSEKKVVRVITVRICEKPAAYNERLAGKTGYALVIASRIRLPRAN